MNRASNWLPGLAGGQALPGYPASLQVIDGELDNRLARFIAVVPDAHNPFPRARAGEVGLLDGWGLAMAVREGVEADRHGEKRAIVAVIDVPSQAYGRREEALGIHQALAGAVQAYAQARLAGHPVIGLLVGKAMSGAFLAHGYQAQRLIALDDAGVMVHAMGKAVATPWRGQRRDTKRRRPGSGAYVPGRRCARYRQLDRPVIAADGREPAGVARGARAPASSVAGGLR